jgi:hypothetical protein
MSLKIETSVDARNHDGRIKLVSWVMEHMLQKNIHIHNKH